MLFDTSQLHAHNYREGLDDVWRRDTELSLQIHKWVYSLTFAPPSVLNIWKFILCSLNMCVCACVRWFSCLYTALKFFGGRGGGVLASDLI